MSDDDFSQRLDLSSEPPGGSRSAASSRGEGRPFLGIHFACCDVYTRVYLSHDETAYAGRCPRCGGRVRFSVGPGGTSARFFRAE